MMEMFLYLILLIAAGGIVVAVILVGRHFGYLNGLKRFPKLKVREQNEKQENN